MFVLMVECARAGKFQSTLKASVTDRTSGHFKAIVPPGGKYPRSTLQHYPPASIDIIFADSTFLPTCLYTGREEAVFSVGTKR